MYLRLGTLIAACLSQIPFVGGGEIPMPEREMTLIDRDQHDRQKPKRAKRSFSDSMRDLPPSECKESAPSESPGNFEKDW